MMTIHDLDPNLFIEALEALDEYSCFAITRALRNRNRRSMVVHTYANGSEEHSVYSGLFAPIEGITEEGHEEGKGRTSSWLDGQPDLQDVDSLRAWRETALCFMAAIVADPWED
jgi:hypothetical protein